MLSPLQWSEIILKRLEGGSAKDLNRRQLCEWIAELIEEVQVDAGAVHPLVIQ